MEQGKDWRDYIPALLAILFTLISPYFFPFGLRQIAPPLGFAVIFFWQRYRAGPNIPLWAVMICGLMLDVLQAMPVGVGISAALLLYWLSTPREERDEKQSFPRNALRHGWVSALVMLWIYLLMSLAEGQFFPTQPAVVQWLALVVSYPLIYGFCDAMHQHMDNAPRRRL